MDYLAGKSEANENPWGLDGRSRTLGILHELCVCARAPRFAFVQQVRNHSPSTNPHYHEVPGFPGRLASVGQFAHLARGESLVKGANRGRCCSSSRRRRFSVLPRFAEPRWILWNPWKIDCASAAIYPKSSVCSGSASSCSRPIAAISCAYGAKWSGTGRFTPGNSAPA